jgi:predicted nucleic acid-binding protein
MDKIVVDSSVVIKWFMPEPYSMEARRILDAYQRDRFSLLVPDLLYAEVGNIVWKKHRFQDLAAADAQDIIDNFRMLTFLITPTADLLDAAYRIAVDHQRTVYDALYVALSVEEKCQFVTADEKLVNAVSSTYSNVIWVANWFYPISL